ncbi:MAG: 3'-5' exoribonuclease YhaM family protein, partial [Planctomycetota bacterium]
MSRRYVSQLTHQESIDEIFLVTEKQLRPNRNGNLYLQFEVSDRTGKIGARLWNANESIYRAFDNGDFVRVEGNTQLFQGAVQLIATHIERVDEDQVDPDDFTPVSAVQVDKLMVRLGEMLRTIEDPSLKTLAECFLMDEELMNKLGQAPAGVKAHHAYRGGLLEHIVNLMEVVIRVSPCYPDVNRDLLLFGAFLHDLGKVDELGYDREFVYTDEGQLIG